MSYDQGYWHTDGCDEQGIDEKYAGTHIALYVKWCITKNFVSDDISNRDVDVIAKVLTGEMTANQYFSDYFDWKFGEWNLNEMGNAFTSNYYEQYISDYEVSISGGLYVPEEKVDFNKLCKTLDNRLAEFNEKGPEKVSWKKKPWWKIW